MRRKPGLFEGYGVELEYMIVDRSTLDVLPVSDEVLRAAAGRYTTEFEEGPVVWSNELVLHVMEIKNNGPAGSLDGLAEKFQKGILRINGILEGFGGKLMPSGMHPWMDPSTETRLWPRRNRNIYETYDRIFDCRNHGWSNIQSVHLNLPFRGDEQFGRLHAAVRLLIPLMPAVAASSPIVGGRISGLMDSRLYYYGENQFKVPSITGKVIPEAVFTREEYESKILRKIYRGIAKYDTEGVLGYEWVNSRGAIPRFDRSTIEIRTLDVQESPLADLALAVSISAVTKALIDELWCGYGEQKAWGIDPLRTVLEETMRYGEKAVIGNPSYLRAFGLKAERATALTLWKHLRKEVLIHDPSFGDEAAGAMDVILGKGPLSRRILTAAGRKPGPAKIRTVYERLCDCLMKGEMFPG
ncbi:MAG: glutamate-cysteine ligase family protein [Candidatus Sulfobium sp.]